MSQKEKLGGRMVVASVSGGKDSAALSLWLTEQGIEHRRVFSDTGWEHPATYEYLRGELTRVLGPIDEVRGPRTFEELVRRKGMFPSRVRRFCTTELKVRPIGRYIEALLESGADCVNAVGIRAEESQARAKLAEWEWQDAWDVEVWRPLLRWSFEDVRAIHARHGLRPNPLYMEGASRVGCWPCIFARKDELRRIADTDPDRIVRIRALEREVREAADERYAARGETIEGRGHYTPTFFVGRTPDARGSRHWPIDAAVEWARTAHGGRQFEMFAPEHEEGCVRWGLCETGGES